MIKNKYVLGYSTPDRFIPVGETFDFKEAVKWVQKSSGMEDIMNVFEIRTEEE